MRGDHIAAFDRHQRRFGIIKPRVVFERVFGERAHKLRAVLRCRKRRGGYADENRMSRAGLFFAADNLVAGFYNRIGVRALESGAKAAVFFNCIVGAVHCSAHTEDFVAADPF